MPRKVFVAGEVLTAADVQTYLADQAIMTFAGTAARGSAISSPTTGMFTFQTDTSQLTYWDGSQWVVFTSGGGGGGFQTNFLLMGA